MCPRGTTISNGGTGGGAGRSVDRSARGETDTGCCDWACVAGGPVGAAERKVTPLQSGTMRRCCRRLTSRMVLCAGGDLTFRWYPKYASMMHTTSSGTGDTLRNVTEFLPSKKKGS